MSGINIKDVAKYYAELPNQDKGLEILQSALDKVGLANEDQPWVIEFRKAEKPKPKLELPVSKAATESQVQAFTGNVNWHDKRSRVSNYFTVLDVTQGDHRRVPKTGTNEGFAHAKNALFLARELDKVRQAWGHPIGVTSWYRPEPINSQVGGVRGSKHTMGFAADIYPLAGGDVWDLQKWLDSVWWDALGYGAKKGFIHLDTRGGGGFKRLGKQGKIRWNY